MKKARLPSIGIQNSTLYWLIFKVRNYKVPIYLKYWYLVTKTIDNYFKYTKVLRNRV